MTASLIWKRKFPGQARNFFNTVSHPDLFLKSRLNQTWYYTWLYTISRNERELIFPHWIK